jgi:GTPase-associated system helical domain
MAEEVVPMREEFPRWYRPVGVGDNRERLEARWKGVVTLVGNADDNNNIETMIAIALRTKPRPQAANVMSIRKTFKDIDDLFDMEGNDRELEILCGSVLATLFETDGDMAALAALSTTTASCGGVRTAEFPLDLAGVAEAAIVRVSDARRTRPDLGKHMTVAASNISMDEANAALKQNWTVDGAIAALKALSDLNNRANLHLAQQVNVALKAAHNFAEIQDEELQMLWWLFGNRSKKMDRPFADIPADAQTFILAAELADMTNFLPGPASVKPILSRAGLKDRRRCSVPAAVNACEADLLRSLIDGFEPSKITQPLHFAIKRKLETGDETSWIAAWSSITGIDAGFSLPAIELGNLFYCERLGIRFSGE